MVKKISKKVFGPKIFKKRDFLTKNGEKWQMQKCLVKKFFSRNRFRIIQNEFEKIFFGSFWPKIKLFEGFLAKKQSPTKKILHGEKFSISRFSVYNTFWNILNQFRPKKFFSTKNFWLCHFFTIFWPKNHVFWLFSTKIFFKKISILRLKHLITKILSY